MQIYLRRKASFSAAHSYSFEDLTLEENRRLFGKWAGGSGHGHNYEVEVTIAGEVDSSTGMVVNISDVTGVLARWVTGTLDGKFLNRDVDYFVHHPPCTENIAHYVWDRIEPELGNAKLVGVRILETNTLWANLTRQGPDMQLTVTRSYDFAASHRLHSESLSEAENAQVFGKCNNANGHGHNYEIEVTVAGEPDRVTGMICDIDQLDRIVQMQVLDAFDHKHLNLDTAEFAHVNPTSEMIAVVCWNKLVKNIEDTGSARLQKVTIRETPRNVFEYLGA